MPLRTVAVLLALAFSAGAAAQTTYKCKDKAGKLTYANTECRLLGLEEAGAVSDRVSTTPALKTPPRARSAQPAPAAAPPATASKDSAPPPRERRCFTVNTAKGPVTRCNDKPDEDAKPPASGGPEDREVRAQ